MKYDYREAIKEDIRVYLGENYGEELIKEKMQDRETWQEELYNEMWIDDSITGNASGSYTFNTWQAEENLCHNMDILKEALEEFGCDISYLEKGAEACDVTIRCYLLSEALQEELDNIEFNGGIKQ